MVLIAQTANVPPPAVVAPSILASDFANLADECTRMIDSGADWLHVDVMDGHFVPNLSLGIPVIASLDKAMRKAYNNDGAFLDCHMMVANPGMWVKDVADAGGKSYTFHMEATSSAEDAMNIVNAVHETGMKACIAINPGTPSTVVTDQLGDAVEMILVMTVVPGRGGQKFIEECVQKVTELRIRFPHTHIQVDGGVGPKTIDTCAKSGANVAVGGTAIFGAQNPREAIRSMREAIEKESVNWSQLKA